MTRLRLGASSAEKLCASALSAVCDTRSEGTLSAVDVYGDGAITAQDGREHSHALLGEGVGG